MNALYAQLCRQDAQAWRKAVDTLAAEIHPIDRNATRIWFAFYPLDLFLALEAAEDPTAAARTLGLMGSWRPCSTPRRRCPRISPRSSARLRSRLRGPPASIASSSSAWAPSR
jgi:hypothetical protein